MVLMDSNSSDSQTPDVERRAFATTSWSMVLEAADSDQENQTLALAELCQAYWFPLYAFVRRKGIGRSEAEDMTQAFFTELLEKNRLAHAEPSRGRFRSFLLASMNNFIAKQWRAEKTLKRGGGQTVLAIDYDDADQRYATMPVDDVTPEKIFELNWALSVLENTIERVRQQYQETGKGELFESLKGFLTSGDAVPYEVLAEETGMKVGALKVAAHRLRQRYGQQLRLQIAKTIADPEQVDEELRLLFSALS